MNLPRISEENSRRAIGPGPKEFIKHILSPQHLERAEEFFHVFSDIYRRYNGTRSTLFPEMEELLHLLHGRKRLALATNKSFEDTLPLIEKFSLDRLFDVILTRDDVAEPKPAPDMPLAACARLSVPPSRSLLVGDTYNDLAAAHAAGMPCCLALWGYSDQYDQLAGEAEYCASNPMELLEVLKLNEPIHV